MQRINDFLKEDEVPDWASSLKQPPPPTTSDQSVKIGYENATLEFHKGSKKKDSADTKSTQRADPSNSLPSEGAGVAQEIPDEDRHQRLDEADILVPQEPSMIQEGLVEPESLLASSSGDARKPNQRVQAFKLENVTVSLPVGKLTLVTGNTGAGKTAFLMGLLGGEFILLIILFEGCHEAHYSTLRDERLEGQSITRQVESQSGILRASTVAGTCHYTR
jgi:hypothetical protein